MFTNILDRRRFLPLASLRLTVFALLAGAAMTFATASAASLAASGHRAGTIAFLRLVPGPGFGGQLFVVRPDGSQLRRVTPPSTTVYSYAWSPDGRLIAYIDQRLSLWLVRPNGTGRRLLLPTSRLSSLGLSWSPDGKKIAVVSPGRNANQRTAAPCTLYVLPIDGGGRPESLHTAPASFGAPATPTISLRLAAPKADHVARGCVLHWSLIRICPAKT
jgi:Tol biopolymer transport system component